MKKIKLFVSTLAVGGVILGLPGLALAVENEDTSAATSPAELTVVSGGLKFRDPVTTSAEINFDPVTLNGEDQTVTATGDSYVSLEDFRGVDTKWNLTVKEVKDGAFKQNNLVLKINPTAIEGDSQSDDSEGIHISDVAVSVATGGKLEHKITLHPSLKIPSKAIAKTYETTLEWTLSPAGNL